MTDVLPALADLKCRNCGAALSPADISPQLGAARCGHCRSLFALPVPPAARMPRPEVQLPAAFTMTTEGGTLVITRRWRTFAAWFLLFFAIVWNGFLAVWHTAALAGGMWFMSLFGLLHTGVGIFLIYSVAAMFVNHTVIRAGQGGVAVKIGPLPWKGNVTLPPGTVTQLYCAEKITHGKNGSSARYRVEAVLAGNRRKTLVQGLEDADHALFIEQQLERHLRLTDIAVAGEHGR